MILNLAAYHFVAIENPDALARQLHDRLHGDGLRGTVLVTPEGLNLFLAGDPVVLRAFVADLRADPRFAELIVKWSESTHVPFKRLRVKRKREIITFRMDGLDPVGARAPIVDPPTLKRWLAQGRDDAGRDIVMIDTRNAQEVEYGTFDGALTLPIVKFTDLPAALEPHREHLRDKTLVSFCTGGVRCEKAAIWMQQAGYDHVLQLDGGILGYFEQVGGFGYRDRCFVFDERIALDPELQPLRDEPVTV